MPARAGRTGKYSFGEDEDNLGPPKNAFMSFVERPSPSSQVASRSITNKGTLPNNSMVAMSWLTSQQLGQARQHGRLRQTSLALRVHQTGAVCMLPAIDVVFDGNPASHAAYINPSTNLQVPTCVLPVCKWQIATEIRIVLNAVPCRTHDAAAQ